MLFNSYVFLFAYLPITLAGFFLVAGLSQRAAGAWLIAASFVFYGWWNQVFCFFLATSIVFNYGVSLLIGKTADRPRWQERVLTAGVAINLLVLVYFKYLTWVIGLANEAFSTSFDTGDILLPLGISFFTFTQIGYLVDCAAGIARNRDPLNYGLFVTFFPHLIAGPILHNQEIMPQFGEAGTYRWSSTNFMVGSGIFVVGLLKKTLLADSASTGIADAFAHPDALTLFASWRTALSYSLQLYFDFSGYSDMAIGLARMFNVVFPLNFNSPYKARSVIEYWQCWHMTLTRYLTRYVFTPLARAALRRRRGQRLPITVAAQRTVGGFCQMIALPITVTMTLAGIWHGSGATFLVFGLLHSLYLCFNHAWRLVAENTKVARDRVSTRVVQVGLTYLCVLVASVFFRAPSVGSAMSLLAGMVGLHGSGPALPVSAAVFSGIAAAPFQAVADLGLIRVVAGWGETASVASVLAWFAVMYGIVWIAPNTQQIFSAYAPALEPSRPGSFAWPRFRASAPWAVVLGLAFALGFLSLGGTGEFLYFQF